MGGWRARMLTAAMACAGCGAGVVSAHGQLCTTQSKMAPALRETLAQTALELGSAVKAGDTAAVRAGTDAALAANFAGTDALVRSTGSQLSGDTLQVTQLYVLDATSRGGNETGSADFACPLADAASSETDFSINGLPAGRFAFVMVEAEHGPHPWLLAFLLQQGGPKGGTPAGVSTTEGWKMAGFYPHARTAGSHDGLWYWNDARAKVAAKQPWLAWLEYGVANALLQPAGFVSSTHLDSLRTEQHAVAPPGLTEGVSADSPVAVKGAEGGEFRITQMNAEATGGDGPLRLSLHVLGQTGADAAAQRARGTATVTALLGEHPELRGAFSGALVIVDVPNGSPEVVSLTAEQLR